MGGAKRKGIKMITSKIVYIASDETQFDFENDCIEYDKKLHHRNVGTYRTKINELEFKNFDLESKVKKLKHALKSCEICGTCISYDMDAKCKNPKSIHNESKVFKHNICKEYETFLNFPD